MQHPKNQQCWCPCPYLAAVMEYFAAAQVFNLARNGARYNQENIGTNLDSVFCLIVSSNSMTFSRIISTLAAGYLHC
jgi:hypothetical protein